jgi:hypothetical protein
MHPRNEGLLSSQVLSGGLKNPNPRREVTLVVIHICFPALHESFFSLAYLLFYICCASRKENKNHIIVHYKNLKPHVNNSMVYKSHGNIHCGGIKNTMHTYFLSCI